MPLLVVEQIVLKLLGSLECPTHHKSSAGIQVDRNPQLIEEMELRRMGAKDLPDGGINSRAVVVMNRRLRRRGFLARAWLGAGAWLTIIGPLQRCEESDEFRRHTAPLRRGEVGQLLCGPDQAPTDRRRLFWSRPDSGAERLRQALPSITLAHLQT